MPAYIHQGRVAFHETDAAGIVHFSNYFRYAEEAETAALASIRIFDARTLERYTFPRVQANAQYNRPLCFPEAYTVRAFIRRIGNSSLTWRFEISSKEKSCAIVDLVSVRCYATGGVAHYTADEKAALETLKGHTQNSEQAGQDSIQPG